MYNRRVNKGYTEAGISKTKQIMAAKAKLFANESSSLSHKKYYYLPLPQNLTCSVSKLGRLEERW